MSDLSKVAEIHYQMEQNREFTYCSLLSEYLKKFSSKTKKTMSDISKATGISVPDISGYRSDRKILTEENAIKLADYFNSVRKCEPIKPSELLAMQSVGQMVNLVEARKERDEFIANILGEATHDARKTQQV